MRRILVAGVSLLAMSSPAMSYAIALANPVNDDGHRMGCPDPDVFRYQGGFVASCTSGGERPGLPIYYSPDLVHLKLEAHIDPPSTGEDWADESHHFHGLWTAWYAMQQSNGQMVIAESWSARLFASNWRTKIIYVAANNQWAIDPSVQPDPRHHGLLDMVFMCDGHIYLPACKERRARSTT